MKRENILQSIRYYLWYLLNNFIGLIYIFIYFRYIFNNGYDNCHPDIQFQHLLFNDKLEFLCDTWFISLILIYQNEDFNEGKITLNHFNLFIN